ncbi:hypothetical protein [Phytoactinopolyspora mesophila]
MRRLGQPEEVAALIACLASDRCSFSTAAVYDVSGAARLTSSKRGGPRCLSHDHQDLCDARLRHRRAHGGPRAEGRRTTGG